MPVSGEDARVIELLRKVDEYQNLVDVCSAGYGEAFLLLSRANYISTRRFGPDSLDMRPRHAVFSVTQKDDCFVPHLRSSRPEMQALPTSEATGGVQRGSTEGTLRRRKMEEPETKKDSKKVITEKDSKKDSKKDFKKDTKKDNNKEFFKKEEGGMHDEAVEKTAARADKRPVERSVRSLSEQLQALQMGPSKRPVDLLRDPIRQFGSLVPPQLKQAQTSFSQVLKDTVQMAYLQGQIHALVTAIESEGQATESEGQATESEGQATGQGQAEQAPKLSQRD